MAPSRGPIDIPVAHPAASAPTTPYGMAGYDYLSMSHPEHTPPMPQGSWGSMGYSPGMVHSPDVHPKYSKFPLSLVTDGLSSSVSSVNSDVDYMSPMSQSYSREDLPFVNSPPLLYDNYSTHQNSPVPQSPPSSIVIDHSRAPTSCPGLVYTPSEAGSMHNSQHLDVFESQIGHKLMRECDTINVPDVDAYSNDRGWASSANRQQQQQHQQDGNIEPSHSPANPWSTDSQQAIQASPDLASRMPFFMDYYTNTLCPSMVYIDGPNNPYREHILQLAGNSASLRHAICALSACNLRMRRKLSLGHDTHELSAKLTAEKNAAESVGDIHIEDAALSEEYQHRNLAVHLLNQQLNDPVKSSHDSVLATILLLCHYRMVESGIAKFHTQFAGIKKILSMRKSRQYPLNSDSTWMEELFTYFDAISASINDREAQLSAPDFNGGVSEGPALRPGAENLVGCDRELFKTISKLGRLCLLAQHRPVTTPASTSSNGIPRSHSPFDIPMGHGHKGSIGNAMTQPLETPAAPRFDGNGFGSTLEGEDYLNPVSRSPPAYESQRSTFWTEWKEVRYALQNWQFDAAAVAANLPGSPSPAQIRDLGALSEAFRYAALLYAERLVSANLPSSHSNFQNLVSQVVYYVTSIEAGSAAEKFLLWPLFVAGSECVNELQQNIVRTKCKEMMTRSGYMSNLSALEVLERLWSTELKESEARSPGARMNLLGRRCPFNWAKCIGGPGVDVEWIMC